MSRRSQTRQDRASHAAWVRRTSDPAASATDRAYAQRQADHIAGRLCGR
jgi:hypothetical protein